MTTKFILELEWPGAQRLLTVLGHPTIPSSSSISTGEFKNPQGLDSGQGEPWGACIKRRS